LEVYYLDPRLRDLCSSDRDLRSEYGAEGAKKIARRVRSLHAAESLDDVMQGPGKCHPLKGKYYQDCYALWLHAGFRLVFRLMTAEEKAAKGVPDATCALVIEIIDYHEG
jgi:proteic killer suppression protein